MYAMTSEQQQAVLSWLAKHPEMWCRGADLVSPQTEEPGIPTVEFYANPHKPVVELPDGISLPDRWTQDRDGIFWERHVEWKPSPLFMVRVTQIRGSKPADGDA